MKKIFSLMIVALLLTTMVSAVSLKEKEDSWVDRLKTISHDTMARWHFRLMNRYIKVIKERNELKARVEYLEANPIKTSGGHSTSYVDNYIQCSTCAAQLDCRTNEVYKNDGTDGCGCYINQRCERVPTPPPSPQPEIQPVIRVI